MPAQPPPAGQAPLGAAPKPGLRPGDPTAPRSTTVCGRCRGVNPPGMQFCQFCGAPLRPSEPAPNPVAASPMIGRPIEPAAGATRRAPEPAHAPPNPHAAGEAWGGREPGPARSSPARLVVITQDGSPGRSYEITDLQVDLGRDEGGILLPNDPYVSPRHARLRRQGGQFFVRDLGSVNGVYVRLRRPEKLDHADLVLLGLEVLRFELVSEAEKALGPAMDRGTQVFGSPATTRYARLCQRTVEGVTRDTYSLYRDETIIGRESGDIVFTSDPFMSRQHAAITRDPYDASFTLKDLGSSNGTYLAIRSEVALQSGDHLRVGQHLFRLEVDPE
jgi:pSer/pThr/pTyr-binding forkhead associated (FHA) protein